MGEKKAVNSPRITLQNILRLASPQASRMVRGAAARGIDTVLPPMDLFPGLDPHSGWSEVTFLDEPCCSACGFPFEFDLGLNALCGRCIARRPAYDCARAAFAYNDASRSVVLAFKHGGRTEGLSMFGRQMNRAGRHVLKEADILIAVPLHYSRLTRRRYNQSALLARAVSKISGTAVDSHSLLRKRATDSQGGLSFSGRRRNVSGAFALHPKADIKDKTIVLIDDVFTTGATLESCARTLRRGGAKTVHGLTLARVVKGASLPT